MTAISILTFVYGQFLRASSWLQAPLIFLFRLNWGWQFFPYQNRGKGRMTVNLSLLGAELEDANLKMNAVKTPPRHSPRIVMGTAWSQGQGR